jgi:WD40 repeat protein
LDFTSIRVSSINWSVSDEHGAIHTLSTSKFIFEDYEEEKIFVLDFKKKENLEFTSPNVLKLKIYENELLSHHINHSMEIVDLNKKEKIFSMQSQCLCREPTYIVFDSNKIIYGYSDGRNIISFDRKTKKEKNYYGVKGPIQCLVFDEKSLFASGKNDLREFNIETEELIASYVSFDEEDIVHPQLLLIDENFLISSYDSNKIGIWSRKTKTLLRCVSVENEISSMDLSSSFLVVGMHGQPGIVDFFDVLSGEKIYTMEQHENCILDLKLSVGNTSATLVTSSVDGTCKKFKIPINDDKRFKRCVQCNKLLVEIAPKYCGRCLNRVYCSKECQNLDWKSHKVYCKSSQ